MFSAVFADNPRRLIDALKNGCNVNKKNVHGETILLCATYENTLIIKILLDAGVQVAVKNKNGDNPLHLAVASGNDEAVELLLNYPGVGINATNRSSRTPLSCAIEFGFPQIAKILIEGGAKISSHDFTNALKNNLWPFHVTRMAPNRKTAEKYSKLLASILNGEFESVRSLISEIGENFAPLMKTCNLLLTIVHKSEDEYCEIARILLENGAAIGEAGIDGETPFFKAVQSANLNMTKVLLEHGANIRAVDENDNTALHHAVRIADMSLTRHLIDIGANVNARNNNEETPLHLAVKSGDYLSSLALLKAGASANLTDIHDNHPLFLCLEQHHEWMIELLLSYGANVNVKNTEGQTFFHEVIRLRSATKGYELVKHLAKLVHRELEVNDSDLKIIKITESLNANYESCLAELAALGKSRFYNDVTLLDLLLANKLKRACYARNDELVAAFKLYKIQKMADLVRFTHYYALLHDNFLHEVKRQMWLKPVATFYSNAFGFNDPYDIANQIIMYYLGDDELRRIGALCCDNFTDIIYLSDF